MIEGNPRMLKRNFQSPFSVPRLRAGFLVLLLLALLAVWAGCSAGDSANSPPAGTLAATASQASALAPQPPSAAAADSHEAWFAMYVEGTKLGYGRTAQTPFVEHDQSLVRVEEQIHYSVSRNGQQSEEKIASSAIETAAGQLLRFQTEIQSSPEAIVTCGRVHDGQMEFTTATTGKTTTSSTPWPAGVGGFKATEESLRNQPMQPGEHRTLAGLMVGFNQIAQIEMTAVAFEPTALLTYSEDLLRIQWTATLPKGNVIGAVWWTDRTGEVMKMQLDALRQVTFRTTREIALAESGPKQFDLLQSTTVRVNRPLDHPGRTRQVRYRVQLESEDPSRVFSAGLSQRVTPIDPHTAEIVVRAIRPGQPAAEPALGTAGAASAGNSAGRASDWVSSPPPTDEDRQPNNLVQSDNPQIVALAKQGAGGRTDPWLAAVALESFVHQYITNRSYSTAFSTAVEVAQSREGACTQHAVLLAALARARGIPARVAVGLVYVEGNAGFAFHMWDEVWITDRWIPLDATRGRGGIGAAHLKLADSSLSGEAAYSCFLPVTQVIGQAKIEILDAE